MTEAAAHLSLPPPSASTLSRANTRVEALRRVNGGGLRVFSLFVCAGMAEGDGLKGECSQHRPAHLLLTPTP